MVFRSALDSIGAFFARYHAEHCFRRFIQQAQHARRTQEAVLQRLLHAHADSDFGLKYKLSRIHTYDAFRAGVPIQTYADIQPYVRRVMQGDTKALFNRRQKILMFAMTSGTTDSPKYVPVTRPFLRDYRRGWNAFGFKALLDHPEAFLRPILQVTSGLSEETSPSGLPCGAISGFLAGSQKRIVRRYYATPPEVSGITDAEARYYTLMRFAVPQDVSWMVTASPATQVRLAKTAALHAESLIRDVRDGTLTPPGEVPTGTLRQLSQCLRPSPEVAKRLLDIANAHGELLPRHYWRLSFLANWTAGTMQLHLQDFPRYFGHAPVRDIGLLATEGRVTIPLADGSPAGVLDVGSTFFEFIESKGGGNGWSHSSPVKRCHELERGGEYRLLMTTSAGFFRYDIGDYVRVTEFLGEAPLLEFLHRGVHVSSVTGEKLTEWQVVTAFQQCIQALSIHPCPFLLAPKWGDPPYYVLYVEDHLHGDPLAEQFDELLCRLNVEYASKRKSGRLGRVQLRRVPPEGIAQLDHKQRDGRAASNEQFKPRYLCNQPLDAAACEFEGGNSAPVGSPQGLQSMLT